MRKTIVALIVLALIASFIVFDVGGLLSIEHLRSRQALIEGYYETYPVRTALIYFALYIAVTGLSLPGAATAMTLAGGAIFGLWQGTLIVSFASSLGALLAFGVARYVLRDTVQKRFGDRLDALDSGIARDGSFYLFAMRLVPAIPFFLINLLMGLTAIRAWTFYWVSQLGMLAGTFVYVNAGTQLARIEHLGGILSPAIVGSFLLLAVFPFAARRIVAWAQERKALAPYPRPRRFDRNLVVIGGGSAGLVAAYIGAAVKARVTLVEKDRMGGECLNSGCVPSKALIRTARLIADMRRADRLGVRSAEFQFDFAQTMERVQRVIARIAPHDSVKRYTALGVECIQGEAKIVSPYCVEVRTGNAIRTLTTRAIVVATGARPIVPPIPGIQDVGCLTSETVWTLRELPRRLVILGGGPIGCELAQCFARFGSLVVQVEMLPRLMTREDPDVSTFVADALTSDGVQVLTEHKVARFAREGGVKVVYAVHRGEQTRIEFDEVLCAVGRTADLQSLGLERLGVAQPSSSFMEVDDFLGARLPNLYACGDVLGRYQFTHAASHTAWYASVNALFGRLRRFRVDYRVMPWCTYTDPEVARVGLNETEARDRGIDHEVTTYRLDELDRAITDEAARGFVKVLTVPGKDRLLGATIVGEHAGELITEFVLAMKHGIGLNKILSTIHVYPTYSEANKYVSGEWKRAHAPASVLRWLQRYHAWMRGSRFGEHA